MNSKGFVKIFFKITKHCQSYIFKKAYYSIFLNMYY